MKQSFVIGSVDTTAGKIPRVSSSLAWEDRWGSIKARWGVGRMHYTVDPGLYALGNPDVHSQVLVTSNYKMSFDQLRSALPGKDAWILVLDTKGINVWCSAGKGTFGTSELVQEIESTRLPQVVAHRKLILPQLAAPGIAAHHVKKRSGFEVIYGPIRAEDLHTFLDKGLKATPEMRRKSFTIRERAVLIPMELVGALKIAVLVMPAFFLLGGLGGPEGFWAGAWNKGLFAVIAVVSGIFAGGVLTPLSLPWLPGRAFSLKGLTAGLLTAVLLAAFHGNVLGGSMRGTEVLSYFLMISAVAAYIGMNFTGASTYTSLSGVRKEMRWSLPLEIGAGVTGVALWIGSAFIV
jgi:acetyl-CoA decarbonylase/synthase complex subunit gamma